MFNTIILIVIGIIGAIYFLRTINGIDDNKFHISDLLITILCFGIIVQAHFCNIDYSGGMNKAYHDGYSNGYDAAIESAELIEVTEDGYFIQFGTLGTQVHEYTFDD